MKTDNRGGKRLGSGAKKIYGQETKTISFRVPASKLDEMRAIIKLKLSEYAQAAGSKICDNP
jgi:hypothetical protein